MASSLVSLPFSSSITRITNSSDDASFCKLESTLAMKMKNVKISLKCFSTKDSGDKLKTEIGEDTDAISIAAAAAVDAEEQSPFNTSDFKVKTEIGEDIDAISMAAAADAEKQSFFNSFIEGVVKKLYLPKHNNVIKYAHWKHLATCSLETLFPGPYDVVFKKKHSVEKGIEEGSFYEFLHDDEKIGKLILMEEYFSYTLDDKEIEKMMYNDFIERKMKILKDEAEVKIKLNICRRNLNNVEKEI